jgi:hypothetical protein
MTMLAMGTDSNDEKLSFEEFKLYYESAEKVTDRRLETNRWNYTVCVAILIAVAVITKWTFATTGLVWVGLSAVTVLCAMAILFCVLWVGQIRAFKNLNNAKFEVLNQMAPNLEFDPDKPGALVSFRPFEKEWTKLSETNSLEEMGKSKIVALKSSNIEYFIPKAFAALFCAILLVLTLIVVFNWPPSKLVHTASETVNLPVQAK